MVFIYTTFPTKEEAEKISQILLEKRMAACVNMWPLSSKYWWENKIESGEEIAVLIKTIEQKVGEVENVIRENHSYKVPCIATISIFRINQEYKEYLNKEIR